MPILSPQAYQNLMSCRKSARQVTHSIKVPRKPARYFTTRASMLAYRHRHRIALIYCTTRYQF
jgi:hypothetical protein